MQASDDVFSFHNDLLENLQGVRASIRTVNFLDIEKDRPSTQICFYLSRVLSKFLLLFFVRGNSLNSVPLFCISMAMSFLAHFLALQQSEDIKILTSPSGWNFQFNDDNQKNPALIFFFLNFSKHPKSISHYLFETILWLQFFFLALLECCPY